jgi:hypothetical protein
LETPEVEKWAETKYRKIIYFQNIFKSDGNETTDPKI